MKLGVRFPDIRVYISNIISFSDEECARWDDLVASCKNRSDLRKGVYAIAIIYAEKFK
jgi:hypothetical protein